MFILLWMAFQVLGESMAGISHNAKNSNLPEFGDSVSAGSKALCGLTEAAAQVIAITVWHCLRICIITYVVLFVRKLIQINI